MREVSDPVRVVPRKICTERSEWSHTSIVPRSEERVESSVGTSRNMFLFVNSYGSLSADKKEAAMRSRELLDTMTKLTPGKGLIVAFKDWSRLPIIATRAEYDKASRMFEFEVQRQASDDGNTIISCHAEAAATEIDSARIADFHEILVLAGAWLRVKALVHDVETPEG